MYSFCLSHLHVVLVHPAIAGNIGAIARVLKNFDVNSLILVNPTSYLCREALNRATRAKDVLYKAYIYSSLKEAIAPFSYVVGTTARKRYKKISLSPREIAPFLTAISQENEIAIVFGPERTGLRNMDLELCQAIMTIPTSKYSSLNLAMAVGIVLYELFGYAQKGSVSYKLSRLATSKQIEAMYAHLMTSLSKIGFVLGGEMGHTYRVLKRLFNKIPLTENDVKVIRGICHQIDWYVENH
ncbi:MAG TPA: RNA methyltransferase [Candidatus Desulfofervidus auxilii]|uniref:tRNA (cytidine/uridine-2'-O-)-methyltransferase TrmJ n=1 Tax=Desulfofervidus auxilii TaxID=1621989 RepID=A0A7V0IA34_DESA2|nr:RNA methyltransferase [Candidatus Desulfofervidus auxilii]